MVGIGKFCSTQIGGSDAYLFTSTCRDLTGLSLEGRLAPGLGKLSHLKSL